MKANVMTKTLSLAVLGLAGMSFAGASMAQCPTTVGQNQTPPGVWSAGLQTQASLTVVSPGFGGTSCMMQTALNQNSSPASKAAAVDQTPNAEQRYRARFIVGTAIPLTQASRSALIFNVVGPTAAPSGTQNALQIFLLGNGTGKSLRFLVGDTTQPTQYRQVDIALPNQSGENRVEIDLTFGASNGQLRYWVTDQATATTDGAPTATVTGLANSAWGGVDQAVLGLAGASGLWRSNFTNTSFVNFDEFDSRRTSFIGQ
ncbi:MAG: hypothetical protein AMXMBFR59_08030 [Rhodanobacteraceae bacterium]